MKKKESILGMAFFGPALVLLTLFLFLPMVLTLVFSFTDYFALNPDMTHFVGLENRTVSVHRSTCSGTCDQQSHTL